MLVSTCVRSGHPDLDCDVMPFSGNIFGFSGMTCPVGRVDFCATSFGGIPNLFWRRVQILVEDSDWSKSGSVGFLLPRRFFLYLFRRLELARGAIAKEDTLCFLLAFWPIGYSVRQRFDPIHDGDRRWRAATGGVREVVERGRPRLRFLEARVVCIIDSACKNQLVVVSVQYGPFNTYIPIRSTTIGKSRVARDPISMRTSWRSNSDIASVTSIGYPRMRASGEYSTTKHRILHASGPHPIPPPNDPETNQYNQDIGLIHSTNGNHLESPNEGSSIDHQLCAVLLNPLSSLFSCMHSIYNLLYLFAVLCCSPYWGWTPVPPGLIVLLLVCCSGFSGFSAGYGDGLADGVPGDACFQETPFRTVALLRTVSLFQTITLLRSNRAPSQMVAVFRTARSVSGMSSCIVPEKSVWSDLEYTDSSECASFIVGEIQIRSLLCNMRAGSDWVLADSMGRRCKLDAALGVTLASQAELTLESWVDP
ncbi:calmodulin-binding transcription activator 2-like [Dorcoceras hygrometricum]|uniref:Calmodulin-binding transcription activator 2-like n=1 Tax=Dorcoceras hygrometricum TaxID=472368 RepID=A0A2Z7CXB1_9LAMI|nr:calmodulin-binding transcription activator 2-like [Dorcoceras hygrometricum]